MGASWQQRPVTALPHHKPPRRLPFAALVFVPLAAFVLVGCGAASPSSPSSRRPTPASDLSVRSATALQSNGIARAGLRCNGNQVWNKELSHDVRAAVNEIVALLDGENVVIPEEKRAIVRKKLKSKVMWRQIRTLLISGQFNNLGVVPLPSLKTADGRPVVLFRSGFTPSPGQPGSCFESLVGAGGVRHVANLYAGPMVTSDLDAGEKTAISKVSGTYFAARDAAHGKAEWRESMRGHADPEKGKREAMLAVAAIINASLLRPGGNKPTGNLHVHCGGGMHRTGMVVGVIDRCLNSTPLAQLESDYKRHVGWRSDADRGGFEAENVAFIRDFDCSLLKR